MSDEAWAVVFGGAVLAAAWGLGWAVLKVLEWSNDDD